MDTKSTTKNKEHDLLHKDTLMQSRYIKCFKKNAKEKIANVQIMVFSTGRMIGDYECIKDIPYQHTVYCIDQVASVYEISKSRFMAAAAETKHDVWQEVCLQSKLQH